MSIYLAWEKAKPFLEPAVPLLDGTHTIDDICLLVGSGALKIVNGEKCALLVETSESPRKKGIHVFLGGGDLEELKKLEAQISEGAKAAGFARVSGLSKRDEWLRVLPGYVQGGTLFYKDL